MLAQLGIDNSIQVLIATIEKPLQYANFTEDGWSWLGMLQGEKAQVYPCCDIIDR